MDGNWKLDLPMCFVYILAIPGISHPASCSRHLCLMMQIAYVHCIYAVPTFGVVIVSH